MPSWEAVVAREFTRIQSELFFGNPLPIQYKKYFLEIPSVLLPKVPGVDVKPQTIGGVPVERLIPSKKRTGTVLLYFHGGGFMFGSPRTHRRMVSRLARYSNTEAISVDYRLAPKHPFPAPIEDAMRVYQALLTDGQDPRKIILGGDSAGGGLSLSLMQELRDQSLPMPGGAVLFSPWGDLHGRSQSHRERDPLDPMLKGDKIEEWAQDYLQGESADNPKASPVFADYTGFPPLWIQVGTHEVLFDDAQRIAEKAKAAGVDVTLNVFENMFHVWQIYAPIVPEADRALRETASWIRQKTES